jgi:hypothetical protein
MDNVKEFMRATLPRLILTERSQFSLSRMSAKNAFAAGESSKRSRFFARTNPI